ncbi:MAG: MarR family transcriptional regulator [Lachnospiraceae bacterium]|nr:MarR family transcriptional regulator [Lachnospiraceae bacterium]
MKLQECINFVLTNAQNTVFSYFKKELSGLDVTPIQYATLKCLWEQDGQMPSQLAETLNLDSSTVTGILGRLEDKKLISRSFRVDDRRKVIVHLTDEGRALEQPVSEIIERLNREVTAGLSPQEMDVFHHHLQVISDNAAALLRNHN